VELNHSFPVLDTLRLVGAVCVLTTHVGFQTGEYLRNGSFGVFLARLDVGVALFFVLSGFLLSRPHIARAALALPAPTLGRYYVKRLLRIVPVYLVTVVAALTFVAQKTDVGVKQWVSSLLLFDVYHLEALPQGLAHMWSLAAELGFYLVLPALMWLAIPGHRLSAARLWAVVTGMVVIAIGYRILIHRDPDLFPGVAQSLLPGYLIWFAVGISLAWFHVRIQQGHASRAALAVSRLGTQAGVSWTLILGLLVLASTPLAGPIALQQPTLSQDLTKNLLYSVIGGLVVLTGVFAAPGTGYARAMSWAPARHLGHISYSIFCIHMVVLLAWSFPLAGVDEFTGHGLRVWLVTVVVSLMASELLYRLVERPAMNLKTRLDRPSRPLHTAAAAKETSTR
jgi:peptidoglycan/LPS O-acetylase OafA/YrhL